MSESILAKGISYLNKNEKYFIQVNIILTTFLWFFKNKIILYLYPTHFINITLFYEMQEYKRIILLLMVNYVTSPLSESDV